MAEFIDLTTKARELAISEATLKARAMSGEVDCFLFLREYAQGTQHVFLPAFDFDSFPDVRWQDLGSAYDPTHVHEHGTRRFAFQDKGQRHTFTNPRYHVSGWVRLNPELVAEVYTKRQRISLEEWFVMIEGDGSRTPIKVVGESTFDRDEGYITRCQDVGAEDLMFISVMEPKELSPEVDARSERSMLRVINALMTMANLPGREGTGMVVRRLEQSRFKTPTEATVRKILRSAAGQLPDS